MRAPGPPWKNRQDSWNSPPRKSLQTTRRPIKTKSQGRRNQTEGKMKRTIAIAAAVFLLVGAHTLSAQMTISNGQQTTTTQGVSPQPGMPAGNETPPANTRDQARQSRQRERIRETDAGRKPAQFYTRSKRYRPCGRAGAWHQGQQYPGYKGKNARQL